MLSNLQYVKIWDVNRGDADQVTSNQESRTKQIPRKKKIKPEII